MKRRDDLGKVQEWPREHWHVAIFVCACIPIAAALLAHLGLFSEHAAVAAMIAGIVYVLLTTWLLARKRAPKDKA